MKHERPNCDEQIVLRMPSALRDQIEREASLRAACVECHQKA